MMTTNSLGIALNQTITNKNIGYHYNPKDRYSHYFYTLTGPRVTAEGHDFLDTYNAFVSKYNGRTITPSEITIEMIEVICKDLFNSGKNFFAGAFNPSNFRQFFADYINEQGPEYVEKMRSL